MSDGTMCIKLNTCIRILSKQSISLYKTNSSLNFFIKISKLKQTKKLRSYKKRKEKKANTQESKERDKPWEEITKEALQFHYISASSSSSS